MAAPSFIRSILCCVGRKAGSAYAGWWIPLVYLFGCLPGIVILSLMLTGCINSFAATKDIYILQMILETETNDSGARNETQVPKPWEVRLGYLGMCATNKEGDFHCATRASGWMLSDQESGANPLVEQAKLLVAKHVFIPWFLVTAAALFLIGIFLTMLHYFRRQKKGKFAKTIASCFTISSLLQLVGGIAFLWASRALKYAPGEDVDMLYGKAMLGFHIFMFFWPGLMVSLSCPEWAGAAFLEKIGLGWMVKWGERKPNLRDIPMDPVSGGSVV